MAVLMMKVYTEYAEEFAKKYNIQKTEKPSALLKEEIHLSLPFDGRKN
jgi:hypothetical protein